MATGNKSSPDLNDALDLFVGDTRVPRKQPGSASNKQRPADTAPTAGEQKPKAKTPVGAGKQQSVSVRKKQTSEQPAEERTFSSRDSGDEEATKSHQAERPTTRMGRPPGVKGSSGRPKDKTSLSLDLELMDRYRNQSWQEQCQLGELVERALRDYAMRTWEWKLHE